MTKVLISTKNSIWGVIINPQSSNTYRHILNFSTPDLKEAFVDKELFDGDSYKAKLAAQEEKALTRISSTKATFIVDPEEYPNETFLSLLNKDFCVIEEDGEEQFYTLAGERNGSGNTIKFTADLDIFFTYGIKDMFNDKDTELTRGMSDRYKKNPNGAGYLPLDNYLDTPLVNSETFDNNFDNLRFPSSEPQEILGSVKVRAITQNDSFWKDTTIVPTALQLEEIAKIIPTIKWEIISVSTKAFKGIDIAWIPSAMVEGGDEDRTEFISIDKSKRVPFPYINCITCNRVKNLSISNSNATELFVRVITEDGDRGTSVNGFMDGFPQHVLENASVIKNSYSTLPISPLPMMGNYELVAAQNGRSIEVWVLRVEPATGERLDNLNWASFEMKNSLPDGSETGTGKSMIGLRLIGRSEEEIIPNISLHLNPLIIQETQFKSIILEPKLELYPYTSIKINSSTKNSNELIPQNFNGGIIKVKANNSYLSNNWGYLLEFKNYGNINELGDKYLNSNLGYIFEDFSSYSIPTDQNAWEEFLVRNKSQQSASFLSKGLTAATGILGIAASPFTGGTSALAAGVASASLAANSAIGISQQLAQRKDIQNTPNSIVNNGSSFSYDFVNKTPAPLLTKYTLPPLTKQVVWDHIYKYGYSFDSRLSNINTYLDNRYWFNYIEASDTFENIKLQASAEIKQLINDTLEAGVTIWHVRDNNFKGIKNYEYENKEMSLI